MRNEADSKSEMQLVVFRLGVEEFGVQIDQVREIVRMVSITHVPRSFSFIEGVVNLRGQILAIIDLAKRLNLPSVPHTDKTRIIVVEVGNDTVGMIVDEVAEVLRIPVEQIDETPELITTGVNNYYLKGVGKLGDRLLILIDLPKILSVEDRENIKQLHKQMENKEEEKSNG